MDKKYIKKIVKDLERFRQIQALKEREDTNLLNYDKYFIPIEQVDIWRRSVDEHIPFLLQTIRELQKKEININEPEL